MARASGYNDKAMGKRIRILHTGGTLGMRPREPERTLAPDEFSTTVLEHVPELRRIAEIETRMLFNFDSSDIAPKHWMALAEQVCDAVSTCDGVVITHGTDAMAYTASALSFLLRGLRHPVILTGSQRPLADVRSDGRANLIGAVDLATCDLPEVAIYFDGLLLRGNRTTKSSSFAFDAFASPNLLPLVEVGTEIKSITPPLLPVETFHIEGRFDPRVAVIRLLPGQDPAVLRALMQTDTAGVLLIAFGSGNLPVEDPAIGDAIEDLVGHGVVVAIASQSPNGRVDLGRYLGGRLARAKGAIGTADMTVEAAAVKLMYLLGTLESHEQIEKAMLDPIAGELTPPSKSLSSKGL
jgi:L-asparaginase